MDIKIITSNRGSSLLVVQNYKFSFHKKIKSTGESLWKCVNRVCKCTVHTLGELCSTLVITRSSGEHCHQANLVALNRQIINSSCKRKAIDDLSEKPAKIIRRTLKENLPPTVTNIDVEYIRKNMYNARRKFFPPTPTSISEVHRILSELDVKTDKGESFLFVNNDRENIVIFSCATNMRILSSVTRIYLDGTFNYCTKHFAQFFTIHGMSNGHYIPLLFCLLPDKQAETYKKLFHVITNECKFSLNIAEVVIDFEKAIHKAVEETWPNVRIIGCRFHLGQAWYRKIQKYGLIKEYQDKASPVGHWLRLTFALTYLDPGEIGDCFAMELFESMPKDNRVEKFADYLVDNYISHDSLFPPEIWAENSECITRTTNACESFHRNFNDSMYSTHPNLFVFLEKIKEFQIDTYIKIQSVHLTPKIYNRQVKNKQKFIKHMIERYNHNQISRMHFLKCVSFHCNIVQ